MKRFAILLDGEMTPTRRLKDQVEGCRVIGADGGIRHAEPLKLIPEVWLGDFDSTANNLSDRYADLVRIAYPEDKDTTDGEIAIEEALARGADELLLIGAFGGRRADHALLHKTMAISLAERGVRVSLYDGAQEGYPVLSGKHQFEFAPGTLFSVIGFADLRGLSITGVKWPLEKTDVPLGSSLTLSNEVIDELMIELEDGRALLIAQMAGQVMDS